MMFLANLLLAVAVLRLDQLPAQPPLPLRATLHHVQGIAVEGDRLWVTSVDTKTRRGYLHLLRLPAGEVEREVEVQGGDRFHPGGISLDGNSVWLPVAEYRRDGRSVIQRRNKRTLALEQSFEVDDHIGCVAAGPRGLLGGNWDSLLLYSWDKLGRLIEKRKNPAGTRYQDMKMVDGLLVASGVSSAEEGAIDWLDPRTLELRRRIVAGKTDRGMRYTNEGMDLRGRKLYLLPEDGPSRLFVFEVPVL